MALQTSNSSACDSVPDINLDPHFTLLEQDMDMPPVLNCHRRLSFSDGQPLNALLLCQCSSASAGAKRRGGPGGLNKVCGVSPELQAIVGEPAMARTEVHSFWHIFLMPCLYVCLHHGRKPDTVNQCRLLSSFGRTFAGTICRILTIRERLYAMMSSD